jgi:uncharacterized protein (TIGR03435 family)
VHIADLMKCRAPIFVACMVIVTPLAGFSQTRSTQPTKAGPQAPAPAIPAFEVTSVKPTRVADGRWRLSDTREGWSGMDVGLLILVQTAYGIFEPDRIIGWPKWEGSEKFDIDGKVAEADVAALRNLSYDQRRLMLQNLLVERFKLAVHFEQRTRPIYALIVAKNGPKFQETKPDELPAGMESARGQVTRSHRGQLTAVSFTMDALARFLTPETDRYVADETGLTGRYDIKLDWAPDDINTVQTSADHAGAQTPLLPPAPSGPSIFTAVQEQLGLKLESKNGPVQVLVIDHAEEPSPN